MLQYAMRRLLLMIPTLFGVSVVIFVIMRVIPGDVAYLIIGGESGVITDQELNAVRKHLGLNEPLLVQFGQWIWGILRFDFGTSIHTGTSVSGDILRKLPITAEIAIFATLLSFMLSVPLGIAAALKQDSWIDYVIRVLSVTGLAVPPFWVGILVVLALVTWANWSPNPMYSSIFDKPWDNFMMILFPGLSAALWNTAIGVRMMRSSMLEVMRQDYVTTARAKGLHEHTVLVIHALKNAILPVVTILAIQFAFLFGGLIVTETVFQVPGLGRFTVTAVTRRDFPVVQGIVILIAFIVLAVNLITDLSYGWLDPRIRYQ